MTVEIPDRDRLEVTDEEGAILQRLASQVPKGQSIVEVGSYRGRSTAFIARGSHEGNGATVYAIDLWTDGPDHAKGGHGKPLPRPYNATETRRIFDARMERDGHGLVQPIQEHSVEAAKLFAPEATGLVFVDGSHAYADVMDDITAWVPTVAPGGAMVLHDWIFKRVRAAARDTLGKRKDFAREMVIERHQIKTKKAGGLAVYRKRVP